MMKRFLFFFAGLAICTASVQAQSEVTADTIAVTPATPEDVPLLPSTVKNYGGFLLDLGAMNLNMPERPNLSHFKLVIPDASKDYSFLFRPTPNVTYSQTTWPMFSPYYGIWGTPTTLQSSSFQLKNGWMLNTYGQYDADGRRVPDPSALPWQRNNFKGAFELKSHNGSFGIRIEVQHGRENPF